MRSKFKRALTMFMALSSFHLVMNACASSEEGQEAEEAVEAEQGEQSGEEQLENQSQTEGENVDSQAQAEGQNVESGEQVANDQPVVADNAAAGQGELQEIIDEMNQGAEAPPPDAQAQAVDAATDAAPVANQAAPVEQAPVNEASVAAPAAMAAAAVAAPVQGMPVASGLPEMGSKMAYIVQKGDTLGRIAAKIYGDPKMWNEIQGLTNLHNPKLIYPGDVVYYKLSDQSKTFAQAYESVARSEVQVQQGDTLAKVASRVLGSSANWKLIWRQNDQISNPDILTAGTTLYYIAPGALQAAVNEHKTQIAQGQKALVKVMALAEAKEAALNLQLQNLDQSFEGSLDESEFINSSTDEFSSPYEA